MTSAPERLSLDRAPDVDDVVLTEVGEAKRFGDWTAQEVLATLERLRDELAAAFLEGDRGHGAGESIHGEEASAMIAAKEAPPEVSERVEIRLAKIRRRNNTQPDADLSFLLGLLHEAEQREKGLREQIEVALYHYDHLPHVSQAPPPQAFWDRLRAIRKALTARSEGSET